MRRLLLPLIAIAIIAACAAWLWLDHAPARRMINDAAALESSDGPSVRSANLGQEPLVQCAAPERKPEPVAAPPAARSEDTATLPAFVDDDPVVACQPTWTPDLGPAIQRGGGRVEFELVDAKGQGIEPGVDIGCELWRKLGKFAIQEGARVNALRTALICDGFDQGGLEPGDYELTAYCGPYGQVKHEFHVSRGDRRNERLELPNWRRIVSLSFSDQAGNALPYLSLPPHYNPPGVTATSVERFTPDSILREPPRPFDSGIGLGGGRSSTTRRVRPSAPGQYRFPTDGGKWHVRVFAGANGMITLDLDEAMFGKTRWQVQSNFIGPEWDNYAISFEVPADFLPQMEKREARQADNPGNKSVLLPPVTPRAPDLYDVSALAEGWQRLIIALNAPFPVVPRVWFEGNVSQEKSKNIGPQVKATQYHEASGRWWIDLPPDSGVGIEFESPCLLQAASTWGEEVELGSQRIVEFTRTLDCATIQLSRPVATIAALGVRGQGSLFDRVGSAGLAPWQPDGSLRYFVPKSSLSALDKNGNGSLSLFGGAINNTLGRANLRFRLGEPQRAELALGGTSVALSGSGIVLRAVGPALEGLPWVEGTLLDAEQDVASKRLRKQWKGSAEEMEECYSLLCKLAAKEVGPEHPDAIRLNELMNKLEDPASREWMRLEGTWYNTHVKLHSSEHGYLCHEVALVPGKHYVLYLWSNSRNELMPDKRIDFVATEGITDLGAVILPAYSD